MLYSSQGSPEGLDFSIERFRRSIRRPPIKIIDDCLVMCSNASLCRIEGLESRLFHGLVPFCQPSQGKPPVCSMLVDSLELHCQLVGRFQVGVIVEQDSCPQTL